MTQATQATFTCEQSRRSHGSEMAQPVRGSRSKTSGQPANGLGRCGTWGLRARPESF